MAHTPRRNSVTPRPGAPSTESEARAMGSTPLYVRSFPVHGGRATATEKSKTDNLLHDGRSTTPRGTKTNDPYFLIGVGTGSSTPKQNKSGEGLLGIGNERAPPDQGAGRHGLRKGLYEADHEPIVPKPPQQRPASARVVGNEKTENTSDATRKLNNASQGPRPRPPSAGFCAFAPIPTLAPSRPTSAVAVNGKSVRSFAQETNQAPSRAGTGANGVASFPSYTPRPASARVAAGERVPADTPLPSSTPIPVKGLAVDGNSTYSFGKRGDLFARAPLSAEEEAEVKEAKGPRTPQPSYPDRGSEAVADAMRYTASPVPYSKIATGIAPNDEEVIQQLDTLDDIIRFFANKKVCRASPAKFIYMQLQPVELGKRWNPYNLRVIPQPLAPCEHLVFSEPTVVHRYPDDRPTEATPLPTFARDVTLFKALSKIRFFKNYLTHKAFVQWRRNIRYRLFLQRRREMGTVNFLARHAFARNVNDLRSMAHPLEAIPMVKIPTIRDGITKEEFVAAMVRQRNGAFDSYRSTLEGIERILALLCQRLAALADVPDFCSIDALYQYFQLTEEEAARKAGHRINPKAISMAQSKANNERRLAQLKCALTDYLSLPAVVKLLDGISVEGLFRSALSSVGLIAEELLTDDEEKSVSFVVSVTMDASGYGFVPSEKDMHDMVDELTGEIISTASYVPRIITNRAFKDYRYEWKPKEGGAGAGGAMLFKHFPLADALRKDHRMVACIETLHRVVERDYAASTAATKYYESNIQHFTFVTSEWPARYQEWQDRVAHEASISEIITSLGEGAITTEEFAAAYERIDEALASVKDMHSVRRGCLIVTCSTVVELLTGRLRDAESQLERLLCQVAKARIERLGQSMTSRIKLIQDRPTTLTRFAEFAQNLNNVLAYARDQSHSLLLVEELYHFADSRQHSHGHSGSPSSAASSVYTTGRTSINMSAELSGPYESVIGGQTSESILNKFESALVAAKDYREQLLANMAEDLREEVLTELDGVITVIEALSNPIFDSYESDAAELNATLESSLEAIDEGEARLKTLCEWEVLLGVPPTDTSAVTEARRRHREQQELWSTIQRWESIRQELFLTPITEVDVTSFSKEVDELFTKTYNKLHPKYQNDATQTLLDFLRETKQMMPTLLHLGNKSLKREHWNVILSSTGRTFDPSITLESLKQMRLFDLAFREIISEQSAMASGEAQLAATMATIEDQWAKTEFKCKPLKASADRFILDDVSEIVQQAEEHMLLIQGCLASRFVGTVRPSVLMWEGYLNTLTLTIDEWVAVQRSWMYLEHIFSFDDIKQQLPKETQMFRGVDEDFREVINRAQQVKACIPTICDAPVLESLRGATVSLDIIQKHLESYLETKRSAFPRFYFLSNDELISILSDVRNPKSVRPHLRKCFENIKDLAFKSDYEVSAMVSAEGEVAPFSSIVNARGNVEVWLSALEVAMVGGLKAHMQRCLSAYPQMHRRDWVLRAQNGLGQPSSDTFPAQCIAAADMVQWTLSTESAIISKALRSYFAEYVAQIDSAVSAVREDLSPLHRSLFGTLLVLNVHNRDVLERLIEEGVDSLTHFTWQSQMTYYADRSGGVTIKHVNASLPYSYEYLGSPKRLVITPLTDRAFLTCTQALHLNLGGAPQGPAGTGKTESVKDLGKALARQVVVFNCSDGMNTAMLSQMFAGLAQAGAWACFDEFNRIELEVLSVVAQQMLEITQGVAQGKNQIIFDGHDIRLHTNFGVFVTMNPGYAGRTELPDNLKALFRPVCMMVPDYRLIAEIMFFSEGFRNAKSLSVKMTQLYKLSSEQLSKQDHYDFGMRAVKSVLVTAGALKRASPDQNEDTILIKAMRDANVPKFLGEDAVLFNAIIQDLYPSMLIKDSANDVLASQLQEEARELGLIGTPQLFLKSTQLYDTMRVRHGVMVVGKTLTGKTTAMELLQRSLSKLKERTLPRASESSFFAETHQHRINPKAITGDELYGSVNATTREWSDGVLSVIVRSVVAAANDSNLSSAKDGEAKEEKERHWIVFDGPVDAVWIENMNTVLDDSKMLCLVNSERIKIPESVSFVFEVEDLRVASPATVSRCGMVYLEEQGGVEAWEPAFTRLASSLAEHHGELWPTSVLEECVAKLIKPFLSCPTTGHAFVEAVPTVVSQRASSMLKLLGGLVATSGADDDEPKEPKLPPIEYDEDDLEIPQSTVLVEVEPNVERGLEVNCEGDSVFAFKYMCAFAFIWGFGGSVSDNERARFSELVRPLLASFVPDFPAEGLVFDYTLHKKAIRWVPWAYRVPNYLFNPSVSFHDMIVPTPQAVATRTVLVTLLKERHHVLLSGASGTGKSIALRAAMFEDLATEDNESAWESTLMVFSARTGPHQVGDSLFSKLRRHPAKVKNTLCVGPSHDKTFVACIDDVNIPTPEAYGATPALEFIRQIISEGGVYDVKKHVFRFVENVVFAATAGTAGGGHHVMPKRLASRFAVINQPVLDDHSLRKIASVLLTGFFAQFNETIRQLMPTVVEVVLKVYGHTAATLLPSPDKSHYTFNSRDVGRVLQGLMQFRPSTLTTPKELADGLMHEMLRVFHDRLADSKDRLWWHSEASREVSLSFGLPNDEEWPTLLYGDFSGLPSQGPTEGYMCYQRIELTEELWDVLSEKMSAYGLQYNRQLDLVMFADAIAHLVRICRVLRQPRGSALLVGMSGCGRQCLANLASFICGSERFEITTSRGYDLPEFRADVKRALLAAGCNASSVTLILNEGQLVKESFLEDINGLLSTGEIAANWEPEELEQIVSSVRSTITRLGLPETLNVIKSQFVSRCRDYFHLVLTMSPVGDSLRRRVRMFPCLVNCMTIDWFDLWPKPALLSVATRVLQQMGAVAQDDALVDTCGELTVFIHGIVEKFAGRLREVYRRNTYVTPSTYLTYLETVATLYDEEQSSNSSKIERLRKGIAKIAETKTDVDKMQQHLTQMKPVLETQTQETEAFAVRVSKEQEVAAGMAIKVGEEEAVCASFMRECKIIKDECQASLSQAMPEYHAAIEALNSLNAKDINEARSYASPPKKVAVIMDAVLTVLDEATGWENARKVMGRPDFIQTLRNFKADEVPEKILRRLKKFTEKPDFLPEQVQSVSRACVSFCIWCRAIDKYGEVLKVVRPREAQLKEAEARLEKATEELHSKQLELRKLEAKVEALREDYTSSIRKKDSLEKEKLKTETYLSRAGRVLDGLAGEEVRWIEEVSTLESKQHFVLGSSFINAALVTYGGPFPASFRAEMVFSWSAKARELGMTLPTYGNEENLVEPLMAQSWVAHGLPNDAYSIQNGAILSKSTRTCLCIDPQGQANRWIRNMYRARGLLVMKPTDPNLLMNLETAVRKGIPTLIENLTESVDAALNPILAKQVFRHAGTTMIVVRDQAVEYHPEFLLFLTTRLPNPHYLPEIQIKVTLVNFALTEEGLRDQFLSQVVRFEQRELEERSAAIIIEVASQQSQLRDAQDEVLRLLSSASGNLLADEKLINSLAYSKEASEVISASLAEAEQTAAEITTVRKQYIPVAQRSALLYTVIGDLSHLEHSYQYSLSAFTETLKRTLRNPTASATSIPSPDASGSSKMTSSTIIERCDLLVSQLTADAYISVSRGLFEKDKLVFAFLITSALQRQQGHIAEDQWLYFMRGSQGVLVDGAVDPPVEWLSEASWDELQCTKTISGFPFDISKEIQKAPMLWKALFDDPFDDEVKTPPIYRKLTTWQRILFMRSFKEEALGRLISQYVRDVLGGTFVEAPAFDISASFESSSSVHPIVLLLSPGTDPTEIFTDFAASRGFGGMIRMLSLGQGQGKAAEELIKNAARSGCWAYLQNCHVYESWMPQLEMIVANLAELSPHEDFRLWLTTAPSIDFPISVLQSSVKVTREPPQGLRANFLDTFTSLTAMDVWEAVSEKEKARTWHKMLFSLSLLHASILERRRFGPLGWNIPYQWNAGDLVTTTQALKEFVVTYGGTAATNNKNTTNSLPWAAIQFMVSEIHYGGRVTDQWDSRCLSARVKTYLCEEALADGKVFGVDGVSYAMPSSYRTATDVLEHMTKTVPEMDEPEMFGLHSNAETAYHRQFSKAILRAVISAQPRVELGFGTKGTKQQVQVSDTIADLLLRLPSLIDLSEAHSSTYALGENGAITALGAVARQEVDRYNKLLDVIKASLENLQKSLSGSIVMSDELEKLLGSITYQLVPSMWERAAYPSTRSLSSWFGDLVQRVDFFRDWNENGLPTSYWLGGFFFPQGLLTAVLQTHSRQHSEPIDQLTFTAKISNTFNPFDAKLDYIADGVYVHGLAVEGARWDSNWGHLAEQLPRQTNEKMPIMWLLPTRVQQSGQKSDAPSSRRSSEVPNHGQQLVPRPPSAAKRDGIKSVPAEADVYECPVYKISTRAGTLSTTGISTNFIVSLRLPSGGGIASSHWVSRGAALIAAPED